MLPIQADGCDHQALLVMVLVAPSCPAPCPPVLASAAVETVRPVWVKLTSEEPMVFQGFDWLQVVG